MDTALEKRLSLKTLEWFDQNRDAMSQILINDYLRQLDLIKKISGSSRETIVRVTSNFASTGAKQIAVDLSGRQKLMRQKPRSASMARVGR